LKFSISSDAVEFLRQHLLTSRDGRERVIIFFESRQVLSKEGSSKFSSLDEALERAFEVAKMGITSEPFSWRVGAQFRDRHRDKELHWIEGIPFVIPRALASLIGCRELILDKTRVRFDPDLEPFDLHSFADNDYEPLEVDSYDPRG
jgi:hypothetical protein